MAVGKGTRVGGYRLDEEVGTGGMGTVWAATEVAAAAGLVAGVALTSNMDKAEGREQCAGCGLRLRPIMAPADGGASFGLAGAF